MKFQRKTRSGFARKDLLAIVACVFVLGLLQVVVRGDVRSRSRLAACLANFDQLALGWLMYSGDNDEKLVWNPESGTAGKIAGSPSWAGGWEDYSISNPDNTNSALLVDHGSPAGQFGALLGSYVRRNPSLFRCPDDPIYLTISGKSYPRVRSVSMNGYMNGYRASGAQNSWSSGSYINFRTLGDFARLKPSEAYVFTEEREDSLNDCVLNVDLPKDLSLNNVLTPGSFSMVDYPAGRHDRGCVFSFADGHVEYWRWADARTTPTLRPGELLTLNVSMPNNPDVARLALATSRAR
jgi:prepilin-type processing-associated H-X9-DG protein